MNNKNHQPILDFWFNHSDKWFIKDPEFDQEIKDKFLYLYNEAKDHKLNDWQDSPESMLALIILVDQFPRNMFRNDSQSYATDEYALNLTKKAISLNYPAQLQSNYPKESSNIIRKINAEHAEDAKLNEHIQSSKIYLTFFYLPLMHSENLADQELALSLFKEFADDNTIHYAQLHRDIIARFARFPHRNQILNRESTNEELEFLKQENSSF